MLQQARACTESWPENATTTTTTDVGIFQRREIKQATRKITLHAASSSRRGSRGRTAGRGSCKCRNIISSNSPLLVTHSLTLSAFMHAIFDITSSSRGVGEHRGVGGGVAPVE